jgi:hypothetical protein
VQAANADEAIAILGMRSDIGVAFTDIQIPMAVSSLLDLSGIAGRRSRSSRRQALWSSGDGDLPETSVFISKPYGVAEIAATLWSLTGLNC